MRGEIWGFNDYLWKDTDVNFFLVATASEDISHSEDTEDKSNSSIFYRVFQKKAMLKTKRKTQLN